MAQPTGDALRSEGGVNGQYFVIVRVSLKIGGIHGVQCVGQTLNIIQNGRYPPGNGASVQWFTSFFLVILHLPFRGYGAVAAGMGDLQLRNLRSIIHQHKVAGGLLAGIGKHVGHQNFFALGGVDDLVDFTAGEKDNFGREIANGMILHFIRKVRQHPYRSEKAPVHVLQGIRGREIEPLIFGEPSPLLLHQVGQQIPDLIPLLGVFPRMQAQDLFRSQHPVHGNIPQDSRCLPAIDLFTGFHHNHSPRKIVLAPYKNRTAEPPQLLPRRFSAYGPYKKRIKK